MCDIPSYIYCTTAHLICRWQCDEERIEFIIHSIEPSDGIQLEKHSGRRNFPSHTAINFPTPPFNPFLLLASDIQLLWWSEKALLDITAEFFSGNVAHTQTPELPFISTFYLGHITKTIFRFFFCQLVRMLEESPMNFSVLHYRSLSTIRPTDMLGS